MSYLDFLVPNRGFADGSLQSLAYRAVVESKLALPDIPVNIRLEIGPVWSWLRWWCENFRYLVANQVGLARLPAWSSVGSILAVCRFRRPFRLRAGLHARHVPTTRRAGSERGPNKSLTVRTLCCCARSSGSDSLVCRLVIAFVSSISPLKTLVLFYCQSPSPSRSPFFRSRPWSCSNVNLHRLHVLPDLSFRSRSAGFYR